MKALVSTIVFLLAMTAKSTTLYDEPYRPLYHFSPKEGWMGDPDGCLRFRGLYHLFWWGHAVSSNLVHWTQLEHPMKGDDGSFDYYSGSVVVDRPNTTGWNTESDPAMVAIYTAHQRASGFQDQRISASRDYVTFRYFPQNPVLDVKSKSFRDPDVFWHAPTRRWVMAVALPDDHKFQFYSSENLREWKPMSEFGPAGSRAGVWEVPNLFELPVEGSESGKKWALICSVSPNRVQYFVGDFDGKRFVRDAAMQNLADSAGMPEGEVLFDFESGSARDWLMGGTAFGYAPARGALPGQQQVTGFEGQGYSSSFHGGDAATGQMRSKPFTISRPFINFLIGGGDFAGETCLNLILDRKVVRTATGHASEAMEWDHWDVSDLQGREVQIQILDKQTNDWGHILVDHIMQSDQPMSGSRDGARWADWGSDFYAPRMFRDFDGAGGPVVWLGWMGNWEYANEVPTTWGRGYQSIPRELSLALLPNGEYRLVQRPLKALESLRGAKTQVDGRAIEGVVQLKEFQPMRNAYELDVAFETPGPGRTVGLNLCVGAEARTVLTYDGTTSRLSLDRRRSGEVSFSRKFPRATSVRLPSREAFLNLRVFVDQSSIEIFAANGQVVMSSAIFPGADDRGIELFSTGGPARLQGLSAWELSSIWSVDEATSDAAKQ